MGHFPRLTAAALDLTIDTPDFTQTITDTLGSLGTSADGFDKYLADTIPLLSAGGDFGASLDADLGLAAGVLSLINPNSLANDLATLPASLAEGNAIVVEANALLGSTGTVTPAGGGTGGGTGGGVGTPTPTPNPTPTPSPCTKLDFGFPGPGQFAQTPLIINNKGTKPYTITAIDITPNPQTAYLVFILSGNQVSSVIGRVVPANGSLTVTVQFKSTVAGTYTARLTLHTTAPDPQPCADLTATVDIGGSTGPIIFPPGSINKSL